jgi:hypothetical protein
MDLALEGRVAGISSSDQEGRLTGVALMADMFPKFSVSDQEGRVSHESGYGS